jgi:hypothetical protein
VPRPGVHRQRDAARHAILAALATSGELHVDTPYRRPAGRALTAARRRVRRPVHRRPGRHARHREQAVNAALATAGDDEVRIAQGTWNERVALTNFNGDRLDISGGWNAAFDTQTPDPALTVVDGGRGGLTLDLTADDGVVTVRNLSLTGGRTDRIGGNLKAITRGDAQVEISDCRSFDGEIVSGNDGYGAGGQLNAYNESLLLMQRCEVSGNRVHAAMFPGWGAGLYLSASQTGTVRLSRVDVHDNRIEAPYGLGAGMTAELLLQGRLEVFDSRFADNLVAGTSDDASIASGVYLNLYGQPHATAAVFRRNLVLGNAIESGPLAPQMKVYGGGNSSLVLGDSVIAQSANGGGLALDRAEAATMALVNLTLADNAGIDLDVDEGVTVSNTLADLVGGDVGAATVVRSRFGLYDGYSNRLAGDYTLQPGSAAVNAGTLSPAGGVGEFDAAGGARVLGYRIDQGAYEAENPTVFVDGFDEPQ